MKLILLPAIFLSLLGLVMMASILPERLVLQAVFVVLAALLGWLAYRVGVRNLLPFVWPVYVVVVIFLGLTFGFGVVTRGSVRWLEAGGIKLQASEIAKPVVILIGAGGSRWAAAATGVLILAVATQPDLGTAMVLLAIFVFGVIISTAPRRLAGAAGLILVLLALFGKFGKFEQLSKLGLRDYQIRRIESFVNPYSDPRGAGYQVIQSTIAIGSGMWTGRGLGRGTQSQLKFLPERHTDFIFAGAVEELGFLGGVVILGLYAIMILGLVRAAAAAGDRAGRLVLGSTAGWLFFQSAVNILMNLGLMPVTGITLPFLSSGGSSLVSSAVIIGLALSVVKTRS